MNDLFNCQLFFEINIIIIGICKHITSGKHGGKRNNVTTLIHSSVNWLNKNQ